ncbi:uncharacterized protein LOC142984195 [Anticarsia gemmatalis]|uniref:uncharacterized protein LOC142984195 n=1 Tax=Anticarsia gemmatalis TaxID=129554 RepID=UPI003F75D731
MSSKQVHPLKNPRVRRMLLMVDNTDDHVATSSGASSKRSCANIVQESKVVESLCIKGITNYNLRDRPKPNYADNVKEVSDADFSPDCSEYLPSPERIAANRSRPSSTFSGHSGDSQCIDNILNTSKVIDTPSTISNLSLFLGNSDFIASSDTIYKNQHNSTIIDGVQYNDEKEFHDTNFINLSLVPSYALTDNLPSSDFEETLQPESVSEINESDITLTDICQNEQPGIRTELTQHSIDFEPSNLEEPSTSQNEKTYSRKRKVNEDQWCSKKNKLLKNSGQAYEGCHTKKRYPKKTMGPVCTCKMNCGSKFTSSERQDLFDKFYKLSDREHQWMYIIKHTTTENIKRMTLERKNNRTQTIKYFFSLNQVQVFVCKIFFLNTLSIHEQMVYTALEKFKTEESITDFRGKHNNRPRKMSSVTESSIEKHISLFPKVESHYTRKSSTREYLSQDLNISKMYRLYTGWFPQQNFVDAKMATKRQYETTFNTKYNYSFFKPKKDYCSTCFVYEQSSPSEKQALEESYRRHLHRKETIRQIKNEEKITIDKNDSTIAIFDLQKC